MNTERILSEMEKRKKAKERRRMMWYVRRMVVRSVVLVVLSCLFVFAAVPVMEVFLATWRSRVVLEFAVCWFGVCGLSKKIFEIDESEEEEWKENR